MIGCSLLQARFKPADHAAGSSVAIPVKISGDCLPFSLLSLNKKGLEYR
jgi:hypothetical protein